MWILTKFSVHAIELKPGMMVTRTPDPGVWAAHVLLWASIMSFRVRTESAFAAVVNWDQMCLTRQPTFTENSREKQRNSPKLALLQSSLTLPEVLIHGKRSPVFLCFHFKQMNGPMSISWTERGDTKLWMYRCQWEFPEIKVNQATF